MEHLQFACPDKQFYPLSVMLTCMNMKITTLMDIYNCLKGTGGEVIELPENVMEGAGTLHSPYGRTRRVNIINKEKVELLERIFSAACFILEFNKSFVDQIVGFC